MRTRKVLLLAVIALVVTSVIAVGLYAAALGNLNSTFKTKSSTVSFSVSGVFFNVKASRSGGLQTVTDYNQSTYTEEEGKKVPASSSMADWQLNEAKLDADHKTLTFTYEFTNVAEDDGVVTIAAPTATTGTAFTVKYAIVDAGETPEESDYSVAATVTSTSFTQSVGKDKTLFVVYEFVVLDTSSTFTLPDFNFTIHITKVAIAEAGA